MRERERESKKEKKERKRDATMYKPYSRDSSEINNKVTSKFM